MKEYNLLIFKYTNQEDRGVCYSSTLYSEEVPTPIREGTFPVKVFTNIDMDSFGRLNLNELCIEASDIKSKTAKISESDLIEKLDKILGVKNE